MQDSSGQCFSVHTHQSGCCEPKNGWLEIMMDRCLVADDGRAHLYYPMQAFIAKKAQEASVQKPPRSFFPLETPLPCDIHIHHIGDLIFVLILQRRQWDFACCGKGRSMCSNIADELVNLFYMFKDLAVEQFGDVAQEGHVFISPMEVQAYKVELRPQQQ
uniref:Uncharacterized protein n=1 Tax=Nelumbo nucifera TaxID=4432 RepID=A0A822XDH2_NELNU|nr:TPA_asm: hypothetical protein HUJ06_019843 [Nelumbo nucifera]